MKHVLAAVLIALLSLTARAETLSVATWNIEWFPGRSVNDATPDEEAAQLESARAVIRQLKPDILIAQELRLWDAFARLTEAHPPLRVNVVSAFRDHDDGTLLRQQVGIASSLPCKAAWSETWSRSIPGIPRGFSFAACQLGNDDKVVLVYGLHLKSNRARDDEDARVNVAWRNESVIQLLQHVSEMERLVFKDRVRGVIVAGDFNTNHDKQFGDQVAALLVQQGFHNTWRDVPRDNRLSWRGNERFEPTTFDYIFTRGFGTPKARLVEVPDGISDHWPVVVELDVKD